MKANQFQSLLLKYFLFENNLAFLEVHTGEKMSNCKNIKPSILALAPNEDKPSSKIFCYTEIKKNWGPM